MRKKDSHFVEFKNNRVFITLFLHVVIGLLCSFIPEENAGLWVGINIALATVFALVNYTIWLFHKNNSKRYFSLHTFVMLLGIAFYMMSPAFRALYPSIFFWLLLLVTLVLVGFLIIKYDAVTNAFVNPGDSWFVKILGMYGGIIFIAGGVLWAYMNATETGPFAPVAIILFFIGIFLLMIAPIMLATPERVKELEKPRY
ncbi:hypothetical protein [Ureibacillus aquaedulcis]|uniref:Uncharacterized protein n=1 Tax=Ureibacillus aquaedulcis TaxID=3058421 RepID=A0ABT8GLF1_9BACL|nr:hypothetical protein [Ureibacillus sp. BA0131]MDN4492243.1 hypothetical protein [Ureibacillus sp. BA0131]